MEAFSCSVSCLCSSWVRSSQEQPRTGLPLAGAGSTKDKAASFGAGKEEQVRHRPAASLVSSPFFICSEMHQEYQKVPAGRLQTQQILHESPQRGSSSCIPLTQHCSRHRPQMETNPPWAPRLGLLPSNSAICHLEDAETWATALFLHLQGEKAARLALVPCPCSRFFFSLLVHLVTAPRKCSGWL